MRLGPGWRTFAFGMLGLAVLLGGLDVCVLFPAAGAVIFPAFAAGVVGIVLGIAAKHGVESLATGTGIAGAWKALVTDTKPPEQKP